MKFVLHPEYVGWNTKLWTDRKTEEAKRQFLIEAGGCCYGTKLSQPQSPGAGGIDKPLPPHVPLSLLHRAACLPKARQATAHDGPHGVEISQIIEKPTEQN